MASSDTFALTGTNRLLDLLPNDQRATIIAEADEIETHVRDVAYRPDKPIEFVFFPLSGVFSMLTEMADGSLLEVATVGNEGMVGVPVFLGAETTPGLGFAQVPGRALRLPVAAFRAAVAQNGHLSAVL